MHMLDFIDSITFPNMNVLDSKDVCTF